MCCLDINVKHHNVGLLDIPDELLLCIFVDLTADELLTLAVLCRRLHYISLPLYFNRHGLVDPEDRDKISLKAIHIFPQDWALVRALRLALFIKSLKQFFCAPRNIEDVRAAIQLIQRLDGIAFLTLEFNSLELMGNAKERFVEAVQELLVSSFAKAKLYWTVQGSGGFTYGSQDVVEAAQCHAISLSRPARARPNSVTSRVTNDVDASDLTEAMTSVFQKLSATHTIVDPSVTTEHVANPDTHPLVEKTIFINSIFPFYPPFQAWVIGAINSNVVTELCLHQIKMSHLAWTSILSLLTLRSLSVFSLYSPNVPFEAISEFLCRHPKIIVLRIFYDEITPARPPRLPAAALPNLIRLTVTSSYVSHFLRHDNAFPRLRELFITAHDFTPLDSALATLAARKATLDLSLSLPDVSNILDWLKACERNEIYLRCVKDLTITSESWKPWNNVIMAFLPRWLTLFPALRRFCFTSVDAKISSKDDKSTFIRSVIETCPWLEALSYGWNEERSVAEWVSMYSWEGFASNLPLMACGSKSWDSVEEYDQKVWLYPL